MISRFIRDFIDRKAYFYYNKNKDNFIKFTEAVFAIKTKTKKLENYLKKICVAKRLKQNRCLQQGEKMKSKIKAIFSLCFILVFAVLGTACDFGGNKTPTDDISADKTEVTSYLSSAWALFSDDEVKDYLSRYEAIQKDVQSAKTKDALEDCKKRFDTLKNDIQKDIEYRAAYLSKPTALSSMKTTFIKSVDDTWADLTKTYGAAISSFDNSVTTLKQAASAAPTEAALSECVTTWLATLSTLKSTAGVDVSLNFDGIKVQVLTDTAIAWQAKTEETDLTGALSAYFSIKYAKISASMNEAATQAELDKLKADFNALTEEFDSALETLEIGDVTDVETMKIVVFYATTEAWEELIKTYGEEKLNAYRDEYLTMRCNVKTISSMSGVETYISDFGDFLAKINNASNNSESFDDYKQKVKADVEDEWTRILKNDGLIITDDQKSKYADILQAINAATDRETIEKRHLEFKDLIAKIQENDVPPVDLNTYKAEIKAGFDESWQSLLKNYPEKITAAHQSEYEAIIKNIDAATTQEDLHTAARQFSRLEKEIRESGSETPPTPPTPTDFATYKANAKGEIEKAWKEASDAANDDPDFNISDLQKAYYQEILKLLDSATEQEQVDRASYEFEELSQRLGNTDNDEDLGYYKERIITNIRTEWAALQETVAIPDNHAMTGNELLRRMESAETFSDLSSIRTNFDVLVKAIKDTETARLELFAYISSAKSQLESDWSELSANYNVTSFKGDYDNLLQQLQNCEDNDIPQFVQGGVTAEAIKAKVGGIKTSFESLKETIRNYNSQLQDIANRKSAALSTMKTEWESLSGYDYSQQGQYDALVKRVQDANAQLDIENALAEFKNLVSAIKNSSGSDSGSGSETDLKAYKEMVEQSLESKWKELLETYPALAEENSKSYQAIMEEIERVDDKASVDSCVKNFNSLVETIKNSYQEQDVDTYKQTVQSSIESYWKVVETGFDVTGTTLKDDYQTLLNDLTLAETSAKVAELKNKFFNSILNGVSNLNPKDVFSYSTYAIELLNLKWNDIDEQYESGKKEYLKEFSTLSDKIKEAGTGESLDVITELLEDYADIETKVKSYVGISSVKIAKNLLTATVGANLNDFLTKEVLSQKITVTKSNGTTEEVAITKDMVNADKVNLSTIGEYSLTVKYASNYYTVKVSVAPVLTDATVVVSGTIGEKSELSSLMNFAGWFTIYSNGYMELSSSKDSAYKLYYSCEALSEYTDTAGGVFTVTYTEDRILVISIKIDCDGVGIGFYQPSGNVKFEGDFPLSFGAYSYIAVYEDFKDGNVYVATIRVSNPLDVMVTTCVTISDNNDIQCAFFDKFAFSYLPTISADGTVENKDIIFDSYIIKDGAVQVNTEKLIEVIKKEFNDVLTTAKTVYGVKITDTVTVYNTFTSWINTSIFQKLDEYANYYDFEQINQIIRSFNGVIQSMKDKCQLVNKFNTEWQALQSNPKIEAFKTGYGFALQTLAMNYGVGYGDTDYDAMDNRYKAFIEMIKNNYVAKYYLKNSDSSYLNFSVTDGDSIEEFINKELVGYTLVVEYSAYDFQTLEAFNSVWDLGTAKITEERKITKEMIKGIEIEGNFDIDKNSSVQFYIEVENDTGANVKDNPHYVLPEAISVNVMVMLGGSMGA